MTPLPLLAAASSLTPSLAARRDKLLRTILNLQDLYSSLILKANRY